MKKTVLLKIINPILALLFITQALSGIFHNFLMEVSYEAFEVIHEFGGYIFVFLVVVHFTLNWNWIKSTFLKRKNKI